MSTAGVLGVDYSEYILSEKLTSYWYSGFGHFLVYRT